MSINLIVDTMVKPADFFTKDLIINSGTMAIDKDNNIVKFGDGITNWENLTPIQTTKEVINKWLTFNSTATTGKLVTLPDLNIAYTAISADDNVLVDNIVKEIYAGNNTFDIYQNEENTYNLIVEATGLLNFNFKEEEIENNSTGEELKISSISFIQNQRINIDDNKPKIETYTFLDSSTYNDLKNLQD